MSIFSELKKIVDASVETIRGRKGIEVVAYSTTSPVSEEEFREIVSQNMDISEHLDNIFGNERCGLTFSWRSDSEVLGTDCNCNFGYVRLLSPTEMVQKFHEQKEIAIDSKSNMLDDDEGYKSLIADWPFWLPVFCFKSGDCFCIDTRKKGEPVVFLEHDVMDDGPNIHGLRIAPNLSELIRIWGSILFVEVCDWSDVTNQDGLAIDSPLFIQVKNAIGSWKE